jgi:E3 ubiquitin-protein ligase DOA10
MSEVGMLPCLMHKPEIMPRATRVKTLVMKKSSKTCPICIEGFKEDELIKQLPCRHIYHRGCIKQWMKKSTECPLCRNDFNS